VPIDRITFFLTAWRSVPGSRLYYQVESKFRRVKQMEPRPLHELMRSLRSIAGPVTAGLSDAELLDRFVARRDEAAFELLLWRHGPTVLGVCRRLLPTAQDAEDAFQATFLALARKAGGIARREAVGSWLYRVAYRVALRARAESSRRSRREHAGVEELAAPPEPVPSWGELRQVLDEEVNRLPARYRDAFVLCCLEGKTGEEAARQLGCPPGTVSSRLTRARERLRQRLAGRGFEPAALAVLAGEGLVPTLPAGLVGPTLQAALIFSSGKAGGALSAQAVAHAEGVLRAMFLTRVKVAFLFVLVLGLVAIGGIAMRQTLGAAPPRETSDKGPDQPRKAGSDDAPKKPVVSVVQPGPGKPGRRIEYSCRVQASEQADLSPAVSGVLKGPTVDLGDRVKKGQLLALIDAPLLVLAEKQATIAVRQARGLVREAEAKVATARAEVQAARSAITGRQADLDGAKANLAHCNNEWARVKQLARQKVTSREDLDASEKMVASARAKVDAATAVLATARADLKVKQSKVAQTEAAVETAKANVDAAEIELEKARYSLGLTKIVAPFDGIVTQRSHQDGQYVRAGEGNRAPLLTIQRTDRMRVIVKVAETDVPLVEAGAPVDLQVPALPKVRFSGIKVSRLGFAVDPNTGSMRVEIDVPNPKQQLRPGMFGRATLHLQKGAANSLRLPRSCLVALSGGKHAVYVVVDGKAHLTMVRIGPGGIGPGGKEVEVVSGLKSSHRVVTDPKGLNGKVVDVEVK
jgi:RND family efflux transporter MFP subunit